jgi:hypothetical protein
MGIIAYKGVWRSAILLFSKEEVLYIFYLFLVLMSRVVVFMGSFLRFYGPRVQRGVWGRYCCCCCLPFCICFRSSETHFNHSILPFVRLCPLHPMFVICAYLTVEIFSIHLDIQWLRSKTTSYYQCTFYNNIMTISKQQKRSTITYSSRDSHVVTHRSTNLPFNCLCMAERTGCPVFS